MPPLRAWQLTVNGATIAGTDQGPHTAPTVVLLHGLASTSRWWDPVAAHLAHQYRVVRLDHRGPTTLPVLQAWLAAADLPAELLPIVAANYTDDHGGHLRLRLDPTHEAQLAHSLWIQDPAPLLTAVRAPILLTAAHHGDP